MKIALDYDATYTADPILWDAFVAHAKERGHDVKIVTARGDASAFYYNIDLRQDAEMLGVEVVYTSGLQKQDVYGADIWIDDRPDAVVGTHQVQYLVDTKLVDLPGYRYVGT